MKILGNLGIAAHPDARLWGRFHPLKIDAVAEGGAGIETGPIEFEVGEIPISLRVPFHKHFVDLARVGPFRVRIAPSHVTLRDARARLRGTIEGDERGIEAGFVGNCRADVNVAGDLHEHHESEEVAAFGEDRPEP